MNDPMINEMEIAYAEAKQKKDNTHEERTVSVSRAVQKYFPPGMKADEAFKLLRQLKEQGFNVGEYRHEGARNWPDGEFQPYLDEATKRNLQRQIPKGVSRFSARKKYDTHIMQFVTKHASISFLMVDGSGVITEVKGDVAASGI